MTARCARLLQLPLPQRRQRLLHMYSRSTHAAQAQASLLRHGLKQNWTAKSAAISVLRILGLERVVMQYQRSCRYQACGANEDGRGPMQTTLSLLGREQTYDTCIALPHLQPPLPPPAEASERHAMHRRFGTRARSPRRYLRHAGSRTQHFGKYTSKAGRR